MSDANSTLTVAGTPGVFHAGGGEANVAAAAQLANLFSALGSIEGIRALAPIPRYAEEVLDNAIVQVGRQRLTLVDDLLNAGLRFDLPNWMGVMMLTYQRTGHSGRAKRTMEPDARGMRQVADRDYVSLPIYITWDDFSFGIRELLEAERVGTPLDTTHVQECVRNCNEAIEDQAINGLTTSDGGQPMKINGMDAPGALSGGAHVFEYASNEEWTNAAHDGSDIRGDVQAMIDLAVADFYYGPFNLYIPRNYGSKMGEDFKVYSDSSIQQRLLEIPGLNSVKIADFLPDSTTLLVQMTSDVVDVVVGQQPAQVSWADASGFNRFWMIMSCVITRWKQNKDGGVGYVVGAPNGLIP